MSDFCDKIGVLGGEKKVSEKKQDWGFLLSDIIQIFEYRF